MGKKEFYEVWKDRTSLAKQGANPEEQPSVPPPQPEQPPVAEPAPPPPPPPPPKVAAVEPQSVFPPLPRPQFRPAAAQSAESRKAVTAHKMMAVSVQSVAIAAIMACAGMIVSFALGHTIGKNSAATPESIAAEEYQSKVDESKLVNYRLRLYYEQNDDASRGYNNVTNIYNRLKSSALPGKFDVQTDAKWVYLIVEFKAEDVAAATAIQEKFKKFSIDGVLYFKNLIFY